MTAWVDATASTITSSAPPRRRRFAAAPPLQEPTWAAAAGPRTSAAVKRRMLWERRYRRRLTVTDAVVVLAVTAAASLWHLSTDAPGALEADPWILSRIPLATAATWLLALALSGTRAPGVIAAPQTEYRRVALATGWAFGLLALAFVVFPWEGLRNQVIVALPIGLVALLTSRRLWRRWLVARRRSGLYDSRAIVLGRSVDVAQVVRTLERDDQLGFRVVGTAVEGDAGAVHSIRPDAHSILASPDAVAQAARELGADTIIVASDVSEGAFARRLSWQLEGAATDLVWASRLTDVASPRISLRHIDGLPLVQMRIPTFEGAQHLWKRALDVIVSVVALLAIAVVTPIIALLIRLDSPGPVFFRQRRVGRDGREFDIIKFRTMTETAETELALLIARNEGSGPLFKLRADPRVTTVGAVLRRFSLDELPQFWNVLRGEMSVVGPRPPLPSEVGGYDGHVFRRLYIKPGITGLWQVSGRSDLSWEESVRLDLHYVENWSVLTDLRIIFRTATVMVRPKGAY
ncbi:sugar transferase [Microbacterium sp. P05]|uniref:sugar transferase n=1 Tax=Microbacterium sp. P05 TaxID=3366948 RepID=UPI0037471408